MAELQNDLLDRILEMGHEYDQTTNDKPRRHYVLRRQFGYVKSYWEMSETDPERVTQSGGNSRIANVRLLADLEKKCLSKCP